LAVQCGAGTSNIMCVFVGETWPSLGISNLLGYHVLGRRQGDAVATVNTRSLQRVAITTQIISNTQHQPKTSNSPLSLQSRQCVGDHGHNVVIHLQRLLICLVLRHNTKI
jgi:hypothetical protein